MISRWFGSYRSLSGVGITLLAIAACSGSSNEIPDIGSTVEASLGQVLHLQEQIEGLILKHAVHLDDVRVLSSLFNVP